MPHAAALLRLALAGALLLLAAPTPPARAAADPLEAVNRRVHAFNQVVRARILAPAAELWLSAVPAGVRHGAARAVANLGEPLTATAALAAGEVGLAAHAAARFGINTTLGLGGIRDRAAALGYPRRAFGFADTACRWGLPSGPYLVLPVLGPSTLRDAGAQAVSAAALAQLLGSEALLAWSGSDAFLAYADLHPALERIEAESLDPYAVLRSAYLQRRAAACPVDRAMMAAEPDGE